MGADSRLQRIIRTMQSGSLSKAVFMTGSLEELEFGNINRFVQGVNIRTYDKHLFVGHGRIRAIAENDQVVIRTIPAKLPVPFIDLTVGADATAANLHGIKLTMRDNQVKDYPSTSKYVDGGRKVTFTFNKAVTNVSGSNLFDIGLNGAATPGAIADRIIESINNDAYHSHLPFRVTATDMSPGVANALPQTIRFTQDISRKSSAPVTLLTGSGTGRVNNTFLALTGAADPKMNYFKPITKMFRFFGFKYRAFTSLRPAPTKGYFVYPEFEEIAGKASFLVTKRPNYFSDRNTPVMPVTDEDLHIFTGSINCGTTGEFLNGSGANEKLVLYVLTEKINVKFFFTRTPILKTRESLAELGAALSNRSTFRPHDFLLDTKFQGSQTFYSNCIKARNRVNGIGLTNISFNHMHDSLRGPKPLTDDDRMAIHLERSLDSAEYKHVSGGGVGNFEIVVRLKARTGNAVNDAKNLAEAIKAGIDFAFPKSIRTVRPANGPKVFLIRSGTNVESHYPILLSGSASPTTDSGATLSLSSLSARFGRVTGSINTLGSVSAMLRLEGKLDGQIEGQVIPGFRHQYTYGQETLESGFQDGKPFTEKESSTIVKILNYMSKSMNNPSLPRVTDSGILRGNIINPFVSASNGRIETGASFLQFKQNTRYDTLSHIKIGSIPRDKGRSSSVLQHISSLWPVHSASSGLYFRDQQFSNVKVSAGFSIGAGGYQDGQNMHDMFSCGTVSSQVNLDRKSGKDPFAEKTDFIIDDKQVSFGKILNTTTGSGPIDVTLPDHQIVLVRPFVERNVAEINYEKTPTHPRRTLAVGSGASFQELLFSGSLSGSMSLNPGLRIDHKFSTSGFSYHDGSEFGTDSISHGGLNRDG